MRIHQLDRIIENIKAGKRMTDHDFRVIRDAMGDMNKVEALVHGSFGPNGIIRTGRIIADHGEFRKTPVGGANYRRTVTDQSIPNATDTTVSFDSWGEDESYFRLDTAAPTKVRLNGDLPWRYIAIMGVAEFATNATGRRTAIAAAFNSSDVFQYGAALASIPAVPGADRTAVAFAYPLVIPAGGTVDYLTFSVHQNSGGALDLTYYVVELWVVE